MTRLAAFVPTWQIDANDHLNTQFYLDHFEQAESGLQGAPRVLPHLWHLRLYRELLCGSTMKISAASLPEEDAPFRSAYILREMSSGGICTTALSTAAGILPRAPETEAKSAPRGLDHHDTALPDTAAILAQGRGCVTHVGIIEPSDTDPAGRIWARAMHDRVSDSSAHLWQFTGISNTSFYDCGVGRAIVELRLYRYRTIRAGEPVRMVSWLDRIEERSFVLCHVLERYQGGEPIAQTRSLTLVLDLQTRKSVALPQVLRAKMVK